MRRGFALYHCGCFAPTLWRGILPIWNGITMITHYTEKCARLLGPPGKYCSTLLVVCIIVMSSFPQSHLIVIGITFHVSEHVCHVTPLLVILFLVFYNTHAWWIRILRYTCAVNAIVSPLRIIDGKIWQRRLPTFAVLPLGCVALRARSQVGLMNTRTNCTRQDCA